MDLLKILLVVLAICIIENISTKQIRRKLKIEKEENHRNYINRHHKTGSLIIFALPTIIIYLGDVRGWFNISPLVVWIVFGYIFVLFNAFIKWKYLSNSNEYKIPLINTVVISVCLMVIIPFII
jgi:hypothetical protein